VDPERINTIEVWRDAEALQQWWKQANAPRLGKPKFMFIGGLDQPGNRRPQATDGPVAWGLGAIGHYCLVPQSGWSDMVAPRCLSTLTVEGEGYAPARTGAASLATRSGSATASIWTILPWAMVKASTA
jgi:hypothetical protein